MTAGRKSTSTKKDWGTPEKYVDAVRDVLGEIYLDPCSNEFSIVNAKVEYLPPQNNGLKETWNYPTIYVNPPYGRDTEQGTTIKDWIKRCWYANRIYKSEVLALIPVAPNTRHWKDFIWGQATSICFLYDTRLPFLVDGKVGGKGAPMACCMVYWGKDHDKFLKVFNMFGAVVKVCSSVTTPKEGSSWSSRQT